MANIETKCLFPFDLHGKKKIASDYFYLWTSVPVNLFIHSSEIIFAEYRYRVYPKPSEYYFLIQPTWPDRNSLHHPVAPLGIDTFSLPVVWLSKRVV